MANGSRLDTIGKWLAQILMFVITFLAAQIYFKITQIEEELIDHKVRIAVLESKLKNSYEVSDPRPGRRQRP